MLLKRGRLELRRVVEGVFVRRIGGLPHSGGLMETEPRSGRRRNSAMLRACRGRRGRFVLWRSCAFPRKRWLYYLTGVKGRRILDWTFTPGYPPESVSAMWEPQDQIQEPHFCKPQKWGTRHTSSAALQILSDETGEFVTEVRGGRAQQDMLSHHVKIPSLASQPWGTRHPRAFGAFKPVPPAGRRRNLESHGKGAPPAGAFR